MHAHRRAAQVGCAPRPVHNRPTMRPRTPAPESTDTAFIRQPTKQTHSVVFAGFSAEAVRDRVNDAHSKWIFTADEGKRGGKTIPLKQIVDKALEQ